MTEGVLVLAAVIYFVAAGIMSWAKSRSFMFLVWMALATVMTALLGLILSIPVIQMVAPETFESQGGGILFLVFLLPVLAAQGGGLLDAKAYTELYTMNWVRHNSARTVFRSDISRLGEA